MLNFLYIAIKPLGEYTVKNKIVQLLLKYETEHGN